MKVCLFDKKFGSDFLQTVPQDPGIYIFWSAAEPIYVGKAKCLRKRLQQYKDSSRKKRKSKMRMILRGSDRLTFESCQSELQALVIENRAIRKWRPTYNVVGKFEFLYPAIVFRARSLGVIDLGCTSLPGRFSGFTKFGVFRDRELTREAFRIFGALFRYLGHPDRAFKDQFGEVPYTGFLSFRNMPDSISDSIPAFFRGENTALLDLLFEALLEKPGARKDAIEIQKSLRQLMRFYKREPLRNRKILTAIGFCSDKFVDQNERDELWLKVRHTESN